MIGKDFLLVDRSIEMSQAIEDSLSGKNSEFHIDRNGCEYQLNLNHIESNGKLLGVVILAFDITDKAFAERKLTRVYCECNS